MSEPVANLKDEQQLRLLKISHYVCAWLTALVAAVPLIHFGIGMVMILAPPQIFGAGTNQPPRAVGLTIVAITGVLVFVGWTLALLIAMVGYNLKRRKHYTFCFVMACLSCLFFPHGTILGILSIIVLLRPSVKALFESPAPAS